MLPLLAWRTARAPRQNTDVDKRSLLERSQSTAKGASMTTFQAALQSQVVQLPAWSFRRAVLTHILSLPDSNAHKSRALLVMEGNARAALGIADDAEVNWTQGAAAGATTINWTTILQIIEQILPLILQILAGA